MLPQDSLQTSFTGPLSQDYLLHDQLQQSSLVWSPCGQEGLLNINSQVRLDKEPTAKTTAAGQLTVDSVDLKVRIVYQLQWRQC